MACCAVHARAPHLGAAPRRWVLIGARACGSRRRSSAGTSRAAVVLCSSSSSLVPSVAPRARRSFAPPARRRGARAPRAGARTRAERNATGAARGESEHGTPSSELAARGFARRACVFLGFAALSKNSQKFKWLHTQSMQDARAHNRRSTRTHARLRLQVQVERDEYHSLLVRHEQPEQPEHSIFHTTPLRSFDSNTPNNEQPQGRWIANIPFLFGLFV